MMILNIIGVEIIIYIFLEIFFNVPDFYRLMGELKNKFSSPHSPVSDGEEEEKNLLYDVDEFNRRIEKLKAELTMDDDGLYDIPEGDPDEFTGTEIITESKEMELDRF